MATGGSDVYSSDEVIDHMCSVCKNQNISTKASVYCMNCKDYYCNICKDIHKVVPAFRAHDIISTDDHVGRKLASFPTSRCDRHPHNNIVMYCKDHDEVGCIVCITLKHSKRCKGLQDISDFVKRNPNNIVQQFIREVEIIETELKSSLHVFHQEQTVLQQNKNSIIDTIKTTRDDLIDIINAHAENAIQKVEDSYAKISNDLKPKITDLNDVIDDIDELLKEVKSVAHNVPEVFALSKKRKEVISKAEQLKESIMKQVNLGKRLAFDLDSLHQQVLQFEVSDLGKVSVTLPRLYKFSKIKDIDSGFDVTYDSCCTTRGLICFTDYNNKCIHLLSYKTLDVSQRIPCQSIPRGVCCVSNTNLTKIAVGLGKKILVMDRASKPGRINVDHDIFGLHYHDGIFYASSGDSLFKYDVNGKLLKSYSKCPDGNNIFSNIKNLVVNPLNKNIHVTDYEIGVITMNDEGNVINIVKHDISRPWGICVDQYGQVFVSDIESNKIIQLHNDGRCIKTVFSEGLNGPQGICFDTARGRFYIGDYTRGVKVYKVENID